MPPKLFPESFCSDRFCLTPPARFGLVKRKINYDNDHKPHRRPTTRTRSRRCAARHTARPPGTSPGPRRLVVRQDARRGQRCDRVSFREHAAARTNLSARRVSAGAALMEVGASLWPHNIYQSRRAQNFCRNASVSEARQGCSFGCMNQSSTGGVTLAMLSGLGSVHSGLFLQTCRASGAARRGWKVLPGKL